MSEAKSSFFSRFFETHYKVWKYKCGQPPVIDGEKLRCTPQSIGCTAQVRQSCGHGARIKGKRVETFWADTLRWLTCSAIHPCRSSSSSLLWSPASRVCCRMGLIHGWVISWPLTIIGMGKVRRDTIRICDLSVVPLVLISRIQVSRDVKVVVMQYMRTRFTKRHQKWATIDTGIQGKWKNGGLLSRNLGMNMNHEVHGSRRGNPILSKAVPQRLGFQEIATIANNILTKNLYTRLAKSQWTRGFWTQIWNPKLQGSKDKPSLSVVILDLLRVQIMASIRSLTGNKVNIDQSVIRRCVR